MLNYTYAELSARNYDYEIERLKELWIERARARERAAKQQAAQQLEDLFHNLGWHDPEFVPTKPQTPPKPPQPTVEKEESIWDGI